MIGIKKFFAVFLLGILLTGCGESAENFSAAEEKNSVVEVNEMKIKIFVGEKVFNATLENNPTSQEFIKKLPLEVTMTELNGNEKYFKFSENFPSDDKNISEIHVGDLMIYDSNYLVVFYKNFSTGYKYTRLGKIENPADLEKVLGDKNILIKFEK